MSVNAIEIIASDMAKEAKLLCFDEFQVTDIADAMILRALLEAFMARGIMVFFTSNRHPDDLYLNGIQRDSFLPCIDLIKDKCELINLDSGIDYRRRGRIISSHLYLTPVNAETTARMEDAFKFIIDGNAPESRSLQAMGRRINIPKCYGNVAFFTFQDLCGKGTVRVT